MIGNFRHPVSAVLTLMIATLAGVVAAQDQAGHGGPAHGNHDPHHDGFVSMYLDLHIELVLPASGGVQLYYTDATRAELPAAVFSDVAVEIERKRAKPETVTMSISPGGDFWQGKSKVVTDAEAMIRVAFLFEGKPVILEVPARNLPRLAKPVGSVAGSNG
jgi:hypothetical protein